MWKWPAFAVVLLLLVLAIGVLLFRGRPAAPPPVIERGSTAAPTTSEGPRPGATPPPARTLFPPHDSAAASPTPPAVPSATPGSAAAPTPAPEAPSPESATDPGTGPVPPEAEAPPRERHTWPSDAEGIRGAVRESLPDLKHCYEEWQKTSPELRGKVKIGFTISSKLDADAGSRPDAIVSSVRIGESELDHVFMEGCVRSVFAELRFEPPADGEMSVTYPIQFDNVEPPPK